MSPKTVRGLRILGSILGVTLLIVAVGAVCFMLDCGRAFLNSKARLGYLH